MPKVNQTSPVSTIPFVGPTYAKRLAKLGIETVEDLINHFPTRYEDYSLISPISKIQPGETVTIQGQIIEIKNVFTKYGKRLTRAEIADETSSIEVIWYNQVFLTKTLKNGLLVNLSGKAGNFNSKTVLVSPQYEILRDSKKTIHTGRLVPIYPETYGISSKWLRSRLAPLLDATIPGIEEYLPDKIRSSNSLLPLKEAVYQIHFPDNQETAQMARERLAFDELFLIQLASQKRKIEWGKEVVGKKFLINQEKVLGLINSLPFTLTNGQRKAIREILSDLSLQKPMNRLLEGDVGSGKTVVAAIAMYIACLNNFKSALMAPTEILANQHFATIRALLKQFGIRVSLETSSKKLASKEKNWDIIVGTHALLSKNLKLENLGLIVIDEQQRFGVAQRALLKEKGINPHLLTMTATPIPRTIALTLYGELDLSYLDELPIGRKSVKTWVVPNEKRQSAYQWIEKQITKTGSQAFIICPLIEESDTLDSVRAVTKEYENLKKVIFPKIKIGLLHGRMKTKEKDKTLSDFRRGKTDLLVATPVVEVGLDIPNATIMMIEAAERFGLAQLHQLRGRVGRGKKQSFCLLFTENNSSGVLQRLKYLETRNVGAELAEIDLELRGPGEIYGTKQHGFLNLRIAKLTDTSLIEKTRTEAKRLLSDNPSLSGFPLLNNALKKLKIEKLAPN